MTNKARTKTCKCGSVITERKNDSENQWERRKACSRKCLEVEKPVERITYLYSIGFSAGQIADAFGVGETTIRRILKTNGVKTRTHEDFKGVQVCESVKPKLVKKYQEIGSAIEAGKCFGIKYHQARLVLLEAGVLKQKPRKPPEKKVRPYIVLETGVYRRGINNFIFWRNEFNEWVRSHNKEANEKLSLN